MTTTTKKTRTKTPTTPDTAGALAALREEHAAIAAQLATIAEDRADLAFAAELGDEQARARGAELDGAAAQLKARRDELALAIASGDKVLHAEENAAAAAKRAQHAARAAELRKQQLAAAARLDAALAEAEAAHVALAALVVERTREEIAAGNALHAGAAWARSLPARALWRSAPRLGLALRDAMAMRHHGCLAAEVIQ
jgi:hypothetical protein